MVQWKLNVPTVPKVRVVEVPDAKAPMSLTPGETGASNKTLWSTVELLSNFTVVPFVTVRLVGEKLLARKHTVLSGQVSPDGGGGGGGEVVYPPPPPLPPHALSIENPSSSAIEPIFRMSIPPGDQCRIMRCAKDKPVAAARIRPCEAYRLYRLPSSNDAAGISPTTKLAQRFPLERHHFRVTKEESTSLRIG